MADTRIKDLPTFSGTPTATDFLAIDGPNETKKIPGNIFALDSKTRLNVPRLESGDDLNTLFGNAKSGFYYIGTGVANVPDNLTYAALLVIANDNVTFQIISNQLGIWWRAYTGSPILWREWKSVGVTTTFDYNQFTYNSGFTYYASSGGDAPIAYKNGNVVTLGGVFKCTAAQSTTGAVAIGRVPIGCEPRQAVRYVQYAGGKNTFNVQINTNGNILVSAYGLDSIVPIPQDAWLNIGCTYICQ